MRFIKELWHWCLVNYRKCCNEAYGDKQQLQINNYAARLGRSQAGNPVVANMGWGNWQGQQRSHDF